MPCYISPHAKLPPWQANVPLRMGDRLRRDALHPRLPRFRPLRPRDAPPLDGRDASPVVLPDGVHQHGQFPRVPRLGPRERPLGGPDRLAQAHLPRAADGRDLHVPGEQGDRLPVGPPPLHDHRHRERRHQRPGDGPGRRLVFEPQAGARRRLHRDRKRVRHHDCRSPDPVPQPVDRPRGVADRLAHPRRPRDADRLRRRRPAPGRARGQGPCPRRRRRNRAPRRPRPGGGRGEHLPEGDHLLSRARSISCSGTPT